MKVEKNLFPLEQSGKVSMCPAASQWLGCWLLLLLAPHERGKIACVLARHKTFLGEKQMHWIVHCTDRSPAVRHSVTFSDFQIVTRLLLFNLIPFDIPKLICKYWELLSGRELQIGWPYIAIFNSAQLPTFYEGCFRISTVFLPPITIPSCWRMLINQAFWCCSIFSNLWYSFQWVSVSTFVNNLHIKVNKS